MAEWRRPETEIESCGLAVNRGGVELGNNRKHQKRDLKEPKIAKTLK